MCHMRLRRASLESLGPQGQALLQYLGHLHVEGLVSASLLANIADQVCIAGADGLNALQLVRSSSGTNSARTFQRLLGSSADRRRLYESVIPFKVSCMCYGRQWRQVINVATISSYYCKSHT